MSSFGRCQRRRWLGDAPILLAAARVGKGSYYGYPWAMTNPTRALASGRTFPLFDCPAPHLPQAAASPAYLFPWGMLSSAKVIANPPD